MYRSVRAWFGGLTARLRVADHREDRRTARQPVAGSSSPRWARAAPARSSHTAKTLTARFSGGKESSRAVAGPGSSREGLAQEVDDERDVEVDHKSAAVAGLSLRARICASMASRVSSEILSLAAACLRSAAAARRPKCDLITSEKLWPGSFWRASASQASASSSMVLLSMLLAW